MQTRFLLGTLKLTETARLALKRQPFDLLCRHAVNEHGRITKEERRQNAESMMVVGPIVSRYKVNPKDPASQDVVITTNQDWSETTITVE